ncbi:MAG TPA: FAD-binding protein [Gemmataceae bacterium]|jgi:hypothetical protein
MQTNDVLLVAGAADSCLADFEAFACRRIQGKLAIVSASTMRHPMTERVELLAPERLSEADTRFKRLESLIVFLGSRMTAQDIALLMALAQLMTRANAKQVILVSTFQVPGEDQRAAFVESLALAHFQYLSVRTVVFRPGHVLSPTSPVVAALHAWGFCYPLVPAHWSSCFLDGEELFAAVLRELGHGTAANKTYALPGPRRSWRELLRQYGRSNPLRGLLTLMMFLPGLLGIGYLICWLFTRAAALAGRPWLYDPAILYPKSPRELLALYNKYSYPHVKIVGYNNGVVHFGHRYPDKTLVSTLHCNRVAWIKGQRVKLDAGTTVRKAVEMLARAGKELYVVPNYSYVSVGTSFFVPIHGSASDFCTMADTIDRVLLYDPVADRLVSAQRNSPAFQHYLYNLKRDVLLLRLTLRIKDKSSYYRKHTRIVAPSSEVIIQHLTDSRPSNVEIRKARARENAIDVYQYYKEPLPDDAEALAFPRDSLGQLWDRLESNRLSAALFHGLVRRFAYHVELFIPLDEFAVFWATHAALPIAKIQLRYIKCDGFLHSPFVKHDCISADLFMLKKHKPAFEKYVQTNFRGVSFNPGKHST